MDQVELSFNKLLKFIPNKEISRFKALFANSKTLALVINLDKEWTYLEGWDILSYECNSLFRGVAADFKNHLSDTMFIYDDIVIFVEHKGIDAWRHPKVSVVSLSKGSVRFIRSNEV